MDEFELNLDVEKFRLTNGPWNELKLNSPESVGYVSKLVESRPFSNKEEWEEFYYNNVRTQEQLAEKGEMLFKSVKSLGITLEECFKAVRFRVVCETWNGIIIRERNTMIKLSLLFPDFSFWKTDGEFDYKYAVDYEVYLNEVLLCGLQIKPQSYEYDNSYVNLAREANKKKNKEYFDLKGVPVLDVISHSAGDILNHEVIWELVRLKKQLEE